jgi:hypothetical protein
VLQASSYLLESISPGWIEEKITSPLRLDVGTVNLISPHRYAATARTDQHTVDVKHRNNLVTSFACRRRPSTRGWNLGVSVLVSLLALAAGADARIVVNHSVAGIELGMTSQQVVARLGRPTLSTLEAGARNLVYSRRRLVVTLARSRVVIVATRSRGERTRRGVGVGSSVRLVRRRIAGVRCAEKAGVAFCRTGSIRPGRRSTTFQIRSRRVVTVTVALGVD